ncbi:hypothetical protein SAMN06296036_120129 [Pseudobacteriovorax antillogorgiicola]|uniref:Uncharacterized protein n=1 Tax=Pseudobacteriovorax antillogorgiicola TaxID=1513793 RepID=A0A1Y6CEU5_9BACT|nr:hypothetical protein EDD56_12011 [Pseudobacteriovorax antillogorgiicola]SMF60472.1 hypothetical protein SAMN06296036_120129 [Pseudobacteriovorax antillogorgiicola]
MKDVRFCMIRFKSRGMMKTPLFRESANTFELKAIVAGKAPWRHRLGQLQQGCIQQRQARLQLGR